VSLKSSAFLEAIIAFLMPYFTGNAIDVHEARNEIIDTLASYATRTRAEFLQAAQIIAFGMTTLDVLAEAKTTEMSLSMRIRYRGCANGLNRSTIQMEKSLDKSLACDLPVAPEPIPDPLAEDLKVADVKAQIEQVQAKLAAYRDRLAATRPATAMPTQGAHPMTIEERNKQLWAAAMMDGLRQIGMPDGPPPAA
jgi:hypothetical protein